MKNFRKSKISALFKKSNKVPEISESEFYQIERDFANILEGKSNSFYEKNDYRHIKEDSEEDYEEEPSLKKEIKKKEGSFVFGDSQTNTIGGSLSSKRIPFTGYNVKRIKNEVLMNDNLRKEISIANIIYICGGGNPQPSGAGEDASKIVQLIRENLNDDAPIIWIAPPPPAFDGNAKGFSSMYDPGMDLYNKTVKGRKDRAYDIEEKLSSFPDVAVVNPFKFITSNGKPGYYCGGECDGIHVPSNIAQKIAQKAVSAEVS